MLYSSPSRHYAGYPGITFAKVMVDADGNRHVPHYKAVDIASDNRLPPGSSTLVSHVFDIPETCQTGSITAHLIYRPTPLSLAIPNGWEALDYVIAEAAVEF